MEYSLPSRHLLGALVLSLALSACGGSSTPPRSSAEPPADLSKVLTVTVRNDQLEEARTWLIVDGQRFRLGSVRANQAETFYYPLDGIRTLHLEFDVTLGQHCVTRDASLGPGDDIDVRIPSQLVAFPGVCRRR